MRCHSFFSKLYGREFLSFRAGFDDGPAPLLEGFLYPEAVEELVPEWMRGALKQPWWLKVNLSDCGREYVYHSV